MAGFSNGEQLVALRQAGVIRNCVIDFNEIEARKSNTAKALIPDGVNTYDTFNIHRGAILLRRKRNPVMPNVRIGGSISDKDLIPVTGPINGAGNKAQGVHSIYRDYEFVGFSISNDTKLAADNVQNGDSLAAQAHGVITVPHQGPTRIQMGDKLMWAVVPNATVARNLHAKLTGRPQVSVFAHLEPYRPEQSVEALIRKYQTLPENPIEVDRVNMRAAEELLYYLQRNPANVSEGIENFEQATIRIEQLRRSDEERVVAVALNSAESGDLLDLFVYPAKVFSK